jgi:hypothetical protein
MLREILALDDWSTILATALPYIKEVGAKALPYLYDKFVP